MFKLAVVVIPTCLAGALAPVSAIADPLRVPSAAAVPGARTEQVVVRIYDNFGVTPRELATARVTAGAILSQASIDVVWRDCGSCDDVLDPRELIVRIVAAPAQAVPRSLGYSLIDVQRRSGCLATIFANRIGVMAASAGRDAGVLVGRAIAHELGHLLLGTIDHSNRGLMRAHWDAREFERDRQVDWLLSRSEAARMRRRLAARARQPQLPAMVVAAVAHLQGTQTGTIRGVVRDAQGLPVAGATITVTSSALLGERTVVTGQDGGYAFRALPPGDYDIKVERSGFATLRETALAPLGGEIERQVTLAAAGRTESVQVVAHTPSAISTPVVGANFTHAEVEAFAVARHLAGIAELSPGLTNVTPNGSQVSINGAFAFDTIFMLNGVDIGDNLLGSPQTLFIEDAIQEAQTLTSGIGAEYGRFTGGVVNAITRSGGDAFSGSLRLNLANPAWSTATPYERSRNVTRPDVLSKSSEGTFGGPLVLNRLWFFGAGRLETLTTAQTFARTGIANSQTDRNRRGEIKLTGTVAPNHTAQGGYVNNYTENVGRPSIPSLSIDPFTIATAKLPNSSSFANYRGVVNSRLLAEAQYSQRKWTRQAGGTDTSVVESPFFALTSSGQYNAPYFDLSDPEGRNNNQLTGSLTSFVEGAGRHDIKTGYEWFRSRRTGGNSQSATNYVFSADFATDASGDPSYDATNHLIPVFVPGATLVETYFPLRNAALDIDTHSLYAQDRWAINSRWSADLGLRFERVTSGDSLGIGGIDTATMVPRLAVAYDVSGAGRYVVHATLGYYSGRYNENQVAPNSNVGRADETIGVYTGPAGQGRSFAPGFAVANYRTVSGSFPTANVRLASDLSSPITKEFTTSFGAALGGRGYSEATYVFRRTSNLVEDSISLENGVTHIVRNGLDLGTFTDVLFVNSDVATRRYQGLLLQTRYRLRGNWSLNGHYTLMLENEGNYEGGSANNPGAVSWIGDYPEAISESRSYPMGRLQDFQRHKLRVWTIYDRGLGRAGDVGVSALWRVNSGTVYSLRASQPLTDIQHALIAAYPDAPGSQPVFFGERGSQNFRGYGVLDTSINYNVPVFRTFRPWIKVDVFNLLNNQEQIAWNTVVRADASSAKDSLGLATGYLPGPSFGKADSSTQFAAPLPGVTGGRTLRIAFGVRF